MSKRRMIDPTVAAMMEEDAGKGVSTKFSDNACCYPTDGHDEWYDALHAFDLYLKGTMDGDTAPLLALLRAGGSPLCHVADLLDRLTTKNNRTPSYKLTDADIRNLAVERDVAGLAKLNRRKGIANPYEAAIDAVAARLGMTHSVVGRICEGKHGGHVRTKKRLKP